MINFRPRVSLKNPLQSWKKPWRRKRLKRLMLKQHFWRPLENRATTWWRHKRKLNMFRKFIIYMISGTNEFIENAMETRRFWRIASFSWISNGTLSHLMLVYMIQDQTHKLGVRGKDGRWLYSHPCGSNVHRKGAPPFTSLGLVLVPG